MLFKNNRSDILLLIVAAIWGMAFVAQRAGMDHIGPFTFNGARFLLGAVSLALMAPALRFFSRKALPQSQTSQSATDSSPVKGGIIIGCVLFVAATLQQTGLLYTSVGNAGFITSLYIILVPIIGLLFKQKTSSATWVGAILALIGLSLLSIKGNLTISYGDFLQLLGAVFWALHILTIGRYAPRADPIKLSIIQFSICGILSLIISLVIETVDRHALYLALPALLYTGILSTAVAYTLQVVAQRKVPASHATIIFSLEAVFALLGGWLLLQETMSIRGLTGCALMFLGVIISQQRSLKKTHSTDKA